MGELVEKKEENEKAEKEEKEEEEEKEEKKEEDKEKLINNILSMSYPFSRLSCLLALYISP